jgi:WD40 repeat protein
VRYWRIANRELIYTFTDHTDAVNAVDFSPDGQTIVSGSYDNTLRLWDVGSGSLLQTIETGQSISDVIYSPDGTMLISGNGSNTIAFWNAGDGSYLGELDGHRSSINNLAFTADQTLLVSSSYDNTLRLWGIP